MRRASRSRAGTGSAGPSSPTRASWPPIPADARSGPGRQAARCCRWSTARYDYLGAGLPGDDDPISPGVFVPEWDDGRIAVGNGDSVSHWVHDDVRVRALALAERSRRGRHGAARRRPLHDLPRRRRRDPGQGRPAVCPECDVEVLVGSTHNHHGPDTAFDVNHDWYEHMTDQAADAVVAAVERLRPGPPARRLGRALVRHGRRRPAGHRPEHERAPGDRPGRAGDRHGRAVEQPSRDDARLVATGRPERRVRRARLGGRRVHAEGRYFTSDYAGVLSRTIEQQAGGEALYFVGALGHLVGPGGANVWEVDEAHPLGNQFDPPPGAAVPGGDGVHLHRRELPASGRDRRAGAPRRRSGSSTPARWIRHPRIDFERQHVLLAAGEHRLPVPARRRPRHRLHGSRARPAGRLHLPGHRPEDRRHLRERRPANRGGPDPGHDPRRRPPQERGRLPADRPGRDDVPAGRGRRRARHRPPGRLPARSPEPLVRGAARADTRSETPTRRPATCSTACTTATGSPSASATTSSATSSRSATGG